MTTSPSPFIKNLFLLFLVITGLYFAKEFLMPLSISAVLATLFLPFCKWLEKKKTPKGAAALLCVLSLLLGVAAVVALLGWQISELANDAPLIKQKAIDTFSRIQQYIFHHFGISSEEQSKMLKEQQSSAKGIISTIAGSLSSIFTNFLLIVVYVFLLLYYRIHIKNFLLKLSDPSQRKEAEQVIYSASNVSQQYLVGLTKMIMCLWVLYSIAFAIVGVKNYLFFAILCGILEIIPFVGNITGSAITVLVAAVQGGSIVMLGSIVFTYVIVQIAQGLILNPLMVGPQVKINPFATIIALILGELIWGIPGVILAIPLIAMFKIVCDHIEPLKPFGFLIGEIETSKNEPGFIKKMKNWFKKKRSH